MLSRTSYTISSNQFTWKTTSHESIFRPSPPKSFAEEVANELCNRVKALGNSHPSVLIGKKKRIMDGLMDVAETIRKDLPKANKDSNISSSPKSLLMLSNACKGHSVIEAGVPSIKSAIVYEAEIKQKFTDLGALKREHITDKEQDIDSKESDTYSQSEATGVSLSSGEFPLESNAIPLQRKASVETLSSGEVPIEPNTIHLQRKASVETLSSGEVPIEPNTIHLRLTKDYLECNGLPRVKGLVDPTGESRFLQKAGKQWKPTKPKRLSKRKATIINFFQFRLRKKSRSEKKLKFRDRIVAFMNSNTMTNFRKCFRFVLSPKKTTENAFAELKNNVLKLSKI